MIPKNKYSPAEGDSVKNKEHDEKTGKRKTEIYRLTVPDALKALGIKDNGEGGLSGAEARKRLGIFGENRLAEAKKRSAAARFLSQLGDPMVLVLLGAAAVSAFTSALRGESFSDVFIILFVVLLNATLGVIQESKAEKALEALKNMSPPHTRVLRNGKETTVLSETLVPGDIVLLSAGDAIPADLRILSSASLRAEEAALTGESLPVDKNAAPVRPSPGSREKNASGNIFFDDIPLGDRTNMLFCGGSIVGGSCRAAVCATGMKTEMGAIAAELAPDSGSDSGPDHAPDGGNEKTPLQKRLSRLSGTLTKLILAVCAAIFALTLLRGGDYSKTALTDTFMLSVSLAVAAVPEGLAAVVTIVLSMGVTKMAEKNAIIRRLTAVETLGCTQVICCDKTGTLTKNKMTVTDTFCTDDRRAAEAFSLCSDCPDLPDGDGRGHPGGGSVPRAEPTQRAAVVYASSRGADRARLRALLPRVGEIPFDSERKLMTVFCRGGDGVIQYTTGAPDVLISRCTHVRSDGKTVPLTAGKRAEALRKNKELASRGLRVIAAAERSYPDGLFSADPRSAEIRLCFLGLYGMSDPLRDEAAAAVAKCKKAGMIPVMITGDHPDTAAAIAEKLELYGAKSDRIPVVTGTELDRMNDGELKAKLDEVRVFARVRPEHKVRIVRAFKAKGYVTAMTGDGVNDAPAVRAADIGIGMGRGGTDVTKNVADMILSDDNFATIVSAVAQGRRIYENIRKAILFLLSSNLAEVISVFLASMLGVTLLDPVCILWINLITDSLPALALGAEKAEDGLMRRPPRPSSESIFAHGGGLSTAFQGTAVAALTLAAYFLGHFFECGCFEISESPDGMTMAFVTLSMAEILHSVNMRSPDRSVFSLKEKNPLLLLTAFLSLALTTALLFLPPLRELFRLEAIGAAEYFSSLALSSLIIPIVEAEKLLRRRRASRKTGRKRFFPQKSNAR